MQIADRSKNEFLAILAHELRNPLAPIRTAVQILNREGTLAPESQWALSAIERQVRQMARLIDDLVDVARMTSNRFELRKERVDLAAVLRLAVETSGSPLEGRGPGVQTVLPEGCDPSRRRSDAAGAGGIESPEQRRQVHRTAADTSG